MLLVTLTSNIITTFAGALLSPTKVSLIEIGSQETLMNVAKKEVKNLSVSIAKINSANKNNIPPSLKITQQLYDFDRDNIIFLLSDAEGNTSEKTAGEIALNEAMITALSSNDALLVGYVAGMEHADCSHFNS